MARGEGSERCRRAHYAKKGGENLRTLVHQYEVLFLLRDLPAQSLPYSRGRAEREGGRRGVSAGAEDGVGGRAARAPDRERVALVDERVAVGLGGVVRAVARGGHVVDDASVVG